MLAVIHGERVTTSNSFTIFISIKSRGSIKAFFSCYLATLFLIYR